MDLLPDDPDAALMMRFRHGDERSGQADIDSGPKFAQA